MWAEQNTRDFVEWIEREYQCTSTLQWGSEDRCPQHTISRCLSVPAPGGSVPQLLSVDATEWYVRGGPNDRGCTLRLLKALVPHGDPNRIFKRIKVYMRSQDHRRAGAERERQQEAHWMAVKADCIELEQRLGISITPWQPRRTRKVLVDLDDLIRICARLRSGE
jgi:hypothetical protein